MSYEVAGFVAQKITLVAGEDLSTAIYKFVKMNASGEAILCTAVTDRPIGVLQNSPSAAQECEIVVAGGTKIKTSAALAIDAGICTTTGSLAAACVAGTDTTKYIVGRMLSATGAANGIGSAIIDCVAPGRAA